MKELKTKNGFNIVRMVEIPETFLREGVKKELSGRETFVDTDEDLNEQIFSADVFEQIESEVHEGLKMTKEDLMQIELLSLEVGEFELVRINKI